MLTLISTIASFATAGLPKLLDLFQDKSDKKHELNVMEAQKSKELALIAQGYIAQAKVEEFKTEQYNLEL